jgi:hypothetical protein
MTLLTNEPESAIQEHLDATADVEVYRQHGGHLRALDREAPAFSANAFPIGAPRNLRAIGFSQVNPN